MDDVPERELSYRLRQQTLLAAFAAFALRTVDFDRLLQHATELCAQGTQARFAKVLKWLPDENLLLVAAGVGWAAGVVGKATLGADLASPAGYALKTGEPVISNRLDSETRFRTPQLLAEHGVVRMINVIVRGENDGPWGVLEVDSTSEGEFDDADVTFLQAFANLVAVSIERSRAEDERRRSEDTFRTLANAIPQLAWMTDATGRAFWFNDRWYDYTGTSPADLKSFDWRRLHHPKHFDRVVARIRDSTATGEPWEDTFPLRRKDGAWRWFLSRGLPIRDNGRILRWLGTSTDVTDQREEAERQQLMTREISHRVMNSLQLVGSLLGLQARGAQDPEVTRAIKDAETRVSTIGQVYRRLWRRGEVVSVDLADFVADLCDGLQVSAPQHRLSVEAEDPVPAPVDRAIPVGLLVNELVTNAVKYAYPAGGGEVRVALRRPAPGRLSLEVADDGVGLPTGFDLQRPGKSLGVRLISTFSRELGGRMKVSSTDAGTRFVLEFPDKQA